MSSILPILFFFFFLLFISQSFPTLVSSSRTPSLHKSKLHLDDADDHDKSLAFLWPLPAHYTFGNQTLTVDPNLSLVLSGNVASSVILKEAFQRYKILIFKHSSKVSRISGLVSDIQKLSIIVHSRNEELQLGVDESYTLLVARKDEHSIIGEVTIEANSVYGALSGLEVLQGTIIQLMLSECPSLAHHR